MNEQKNFSLKPMLLCFIGFIVLSVAIMTGLIYVLQHDSVKTITEIGNIYMEGISDKNVQHFETIVETRLDQLAEIGLNEDQADMIESAKTKGMSSLAIYDSQGNVDLLYGEPSELNSKATFLKGIQDGEIVVRTGVSPNGRVIAFGIPYRGKALVGEIPATDLAARLFKPEEKSPVASLIIANDGSYVIRDSDDGFNGSYFDRWKSEDVKGLQQAMEKNETYSNVWTEHGERIRIYATPLPYTKSYLITTMPFGVINDLINGLNMKTIFWIGLGSVLIFGVLLIGFYQYYRFSKRQIEQLRILNDKLMVASNAKSEFLSKMSHDIRTPMNGIMGMTTIALAHEEDRDRVKHCLLKIMQSSKHLLSLINDVLDMSKIESGKLTLQYEVLSLKELVGDIVAIAQPQVLAKHQDFDVLLSNVEYENVYGDSVRMSQILMNLLSNAIKFTPEGGRITVSLREEALEDKPEFIRLHMVVEDTGIGMSKEFIAKIYDSFTRERSQIVDHTEGSGLGMAITKHIIDAMDGQILIESEIGSGSQFHVILDLKKADAFGTVVSLPPLNLMVIDDDPLFLETVSESLEQMGISLESYIDVNKALNKLKEKHYDVVLLDWKMPSCDGIELTKRIRAQVAEPIPIILISAYDFSEIQSQAKEAGIDGFIQKPLFPSSLYEGIQPFFTLEEKEVEKKEENSSLAGKRILIAEDNELNYEIAHDLLEERGLLLERAKDGKEALDLFESSLVGYYDAILMDIRMPNMDGYEAAKRIRHSKRADADVLILAMTADAFNEDATRAKEAGMNAHIPKPIDIVLVMQMLRKYLSAPSTS